MGTIKLGGHTYLTLAVNEEPNTEFLADLVEIQKQKGEEDNYVGR